MKSIKINVPEGYEIDEENSTYGEIVFKKTANPANGWGNLQEIGGWWVDNDADITEAGQNCVVVEQNRNVFVTKAQAKSSRAMAMLSQLMKKANNGWEPDWSDGYTDKYVIKAAPHRAILAYRQQSVVTFLAFQYVDIRDEFLKDNITLIREYLMLPEGSDECVQP